MKKYRLVFVLSILFLGVIKLTASEYEQVRKAPRVHVPVSYTHLTLPTKLEV